MRSNERLVTPISSALVRPLTSVLSNMLLQITSRCELFAAVVVLAVECLSRVDPLVSIQSVERVERLITAIFLTGIGPFPCVHPAVYFETVRGEKGFVTAIKITLVAEFAFVGLHMGL